jgi:Caspase domain
MTSEAGQLTGSRAVLIGVSAYEYAEFPPIRAARNSLQAMRTLLADPALCGWPPEQVTVIPNPISAADLATNIADLAENTAGVLLLYYVGHGVLSARGELCLTVTSTRPDRPKISGLPWDTVADVLRGCPASRRLAILDCCFAGQAIEALTGDGDPGLADIAHVEGVYTLTATTRNRAAHVPPPGQQDAACTSFTGELQDLVRSGLPGKAPELTFGDIYPALRQRLRGKGLPAPGQRGTDAAGRFAFTANAAVPSDPSARSSAASAAGQLPAEQLPAEQLAAGEADSPVPADGDPPSAEPGQSRHASIVTDALRAAHSITSEGAQARALAAVAEALAATDPDRAARLLIDADRVAQSTPGENPRAAAVAVVAGPLAAVDPDRAELAAGSITGDGPKAQGLAAMAKVLAATDPDRAARLAADAEALAESIPQPNAKASALAAVAGGLTSTDSDRAERVAHSITEASPKALALATLARDLAATDPDRSSRLAAEAERGSQSISGASLRAPALAAVARAMAATDPGRAARIIADAERLAQSIPDSNGKAAALAAVAEGLTATDLNHAERLAQSITTANSRALALAAVAKALATFDPDPGADTA